MTIVKKLGANKEKAKSFKNAFLKKVGFFEVKDTSF